MAAGSSTALAFALDRLPGAEFAVAMHPHAERVLVARRGAAVVGSATVVRTDTALSGAPVTVAVLADDQAAVEAVASLIAGCLDEDALELLGPAAAPADVARSLAALVGGAAVPVMRQRLWTCTAPVAPAGVAGRARPLGVADHDVVSRWLDEFSVEALGLPRRGRDAWLAELVEVTGMRLWVVDGRPVSMAMGRRSTPCSGRIGPVYTPPTDRGRGYAAALTAAVTSELLAGGLERTVLLTDVTNPTSNRLYARVGYRQVDDHESWVVRAA